MRFQSPKGTRDFYPEDMSVLNWVMDGWRRVSLRNGFEEYEGPIFESLDLYRAKSGEAIVSELFHFEDRGGREMAIRPEMTPTLARMVGARAQSLPRPIKWFSMPRLCRAERPQRGRLREFFQWNIDIVGGDEPLADAECVFVAVDFFREMGLTPADMVMRINSRSLLAALLVARGFEENRHGGLFAILDKRDKVPPEVYAAQLATITRDDSERALLDGISQARGPAGIDELAAMAEGNQAAIAELDRLRGLLDVLALMGVGEFCAFDMGVVRGLAYYTGVVFEGFAKGTFQRAICGGGRYGQLLEILGGPPLSGVGFGTSDVVILEVLAELGRVPESARTGRRVDFFLIDAEEALFTEIIRLAAELRRRGFCAEYSHRRQNVGKQLKQAAGLKAGCAVIVGAEWRQRGVLSVKDLIAGEQAELTLETFLAQASGSVRR